MMLSFPRMFSLFNTLPHPPLRLAQPIEAPVRRPPALPPAASPGFLQAGYAPFEPGLTHEIRQALGEQAARHAGDVP